MNLLELKRLLEKYYYHNDIHKSYYSYGTAGFRYIHTELTPIMLRVGIAVSILSATNTSSSSNNNNSSIVRCEEYGVMITASHNTEEYNGVKIAGPDGGMINMKEEELVTYIVNQRNNDTLIQYIQDKMNNCNNNNNNKITIHIGYDTREHSVSLKCLVKSGIKVTLCETSTNIIDHGIVTTPQLHHFVKHSNGIQNYILPIYIPIRLGITGYYEIIIQSYIALLSTKDNNKDTKPIQPSLIVDCACGVGYIHLQHIAKQLEICCKYARKIIPINGPDDGPLNELCGSEYVQKQQQPCKFYNTDIDYNNNNNNNQQKYYCAAFDGDADRIVFFYCDDNNSNNNNNKSFHLLDGDKMACLIGNFIQEQLNIIQNEVKNTIVGYDNTTITTTTNIKLGVVQTAYANGASTQYLQKQNVLTMMAKTGVKYVHAAAHDNYDIGVYFESNGHGTVLFNNKYYNYIHSIETIFNNNNKNNISLIAKHALHRLRILPALINQAVGDAISDLLLIDSILQLQNNMSIQEWSTSLYNDLPSKQLKVKVHDRTIIKTNDNETICIEPNNVQVELNNVMEKYSNGRTFIRPSGTEDVVRIYAEASTQDDANQLANTVADIVHRLCGGISSSTSETTTTTTHSRM